MDPASSYVEEGFKNCVRIRTNKEFENKLEYVQLWHTPVQHKMAEGKCI
jgi:hypothetical protein